jgi:hypothetical protein
MTEQDAAAGLFIALWSVTALVMVLSGVGACVGFFVFIKFNGRKCAHERRTRDRARDRAEANAIGMACEAAARADVVATHAEGGWSAATRLVAHSEHESKRLDLAVTKMQGSFRMRLDARKSTRHAAMEQRKAVEKAAKKEARELAARMLHMDEKTVGIAPPPPKPKPRGLFGALRAKLAPAPVVAAADDAEREERSNEALLDAMEAGGADLSQLSPSAKAVLVKFTEDEEGY